MIVYKTLLLKLTWLCIQEIPLLRAYKDFLRESDQRQNSGLSPLVTCHPTTLSYSIIHWHVETTLGSSLFLSNLFHLAWYSQHSLGFEKPKLLTYRSLQVNKLSPTASKCNQILFHAQDTFKLLRCHSLYNRVYSTWPFWLYFTMILWTISCLGKTDSGFLTDSAIRQNYIEPLLCARWIRDIFGDSAFPPPRSMMTWIHKKKLTL